MSSQNPPRSAIDLVPARRTTTSLPATHCPTTNAMSASSRTFSPPIPIQLTLLPMTYLSKPSPSVSGTPASQPLPTDGLLLTLTSSVSTPSGPRPLCVQILPMYVSDPATALAFQTQVKLSLQRRSKWKQLKVYVLKRLLFSLLTESSPCPCYCTATLQKP
jgi:hypothetical protein